jgi:putative sterol carrier protein
VDERAHPPEDITPRDFFTRWIPDAVARDAQRRAKLGDTEASIVFTIEPPDAPAEPYTLEIAGGAVRGREGRASAPNLDVRVDLDTWRALNRGEISAPEALLRRRLRMTGNLALALKLHLILG